MPSQEFNALKSAITSFPEANNNSVLATLDTQAQGIFLVPSQGVIGRPSDITGYTLKAANEDGKLEWALDTGITVPGTGSVWFSDSSGNATGDPLNFYWDDQNKRLAIQLNGGQPEYAIDALGGIQGDTLFINDTTTGLNIGINAPTLPSSYNLILPDSAGAIGQVLATDGNGNLAWVTNGSGGNIVPGVGTIWFSNTTGGPTGNTASLNWDGNNLNIVGNVNVSNLVTALNFKSLSDIILKRNITPIHDPLTTLKKIEGVSYYWKDPHCSQKEQWGVIAQQLEKADLTNLVDDGPEYKSVEYNQIIPLRVESVKTLTKEVETLRGF